MLTIADFLPVPVDLELKHPVSNEPLGVFIRVVGPDSTEFRDARNAFIKKHPINSDAPDAVALQAENDVILASLIVGWSSDEFFQGPFTKAAALALISNPGYNWLKRQLGDFTDKTSNFFRAGGVPG
jgi:hypothetical protein